MIELKVLDTDEPGVIITNLNIHRCIVIGQQIGNFFGPLYKTVSPAVKIFFVAHIQRFGLCFKAIKIKVKNAAVAANVFVNDGECRACGRFFHAHFFAQGFNEGGFAGTHIAVK